MGSDYASMPPPPPSGASGPPGWTDQRTAPPTVVNAVRLMFVIAALAIISVIVVLVDKDSLRRAIEKNDRSLSGSDLDNTVNVAITITVVVAIVLVVLYVLLALQVRKGKNWARITTWVLSGLGALGAISNLAQPQASLTKVVSGVELVIYLALIVLLAMGPSNAYFRRGRYYT